MENKYVGYILLGVSLLIALNIFSFNSVIKSTSQDSCGIEDCPYHQSFNNLLFLSIGTIAILLIVSAILIFSKPDERLVIKTKTIHKNLKKKKVDLSKLKPEEKEVYNIIKENNAMFQADLIEKTQVGKAKMTRIIDHLEGQNLVERKRRGMNNIVIIKED